MRPYLLLVLGVLACGGEEPAETIETVDPEPAPTAEPAPVASPPALEAIPTASAGHAQLAEPFLERGFTFPVRDLEAGFGTDGNLVMIELEPPTVDGLSVQLTFHGERALAAGGYRVLPVVAGEPNVFTIALGRTNLRPAHGELQVESVSEDAIVATLDVEVRHPMMPTPTQLRARIHATHDTYYDAAIRHEQAIRDQLKRR